jgi:predicted TIM-barrel fold metal-dependent hydrolase
VSQTTNLPDHRELTSTDRLLLFSSDCHASPVPETYRDYLEKRYLGDLDEYLASQADWMKGLRVTDDVELRTLYATELPPRLPVLEADGFVGEVIFPDGGAHNGIPFSGLFGSPGNFPTELHAAALRAYNRWLIETAEPERQLGLALIPLHDPAYAATEVERARQMGLRGVLFQWDGADPAYPQFFDKALDVVWAACAANNLGVHFHFGQGLPKTIYPDAKALRPRGLVAEVDFWCRRPLWHLIWGGALERHPTLKLVFTETKVDWIPRTIRYMDWQWETARDRERCPLAPSEYWRRQCYVGATNPTLEENGMREFFTVERFMYGTDFPHSMSPWGVLNEFLQATFGPTGVNEAEARAILGDGAAELYGIDRAKLAPIVERIGPRPEDVLQTAEGVDPLIGLPEHIRHGIIRPLSMV